MAIRGRKSTKCNVRGINDVQKLEIQMWLIEQIDKHLENWTGLRDFAGGEHWRWLAPLAHLYSKNYDRYRKEGNDETKAKAKDKAFTQSAKDAGRLLKNAVSNDSREFEIQARYGNKYRLLS